MEMHTHIDSVSVREGRRKTGSVTEGVQVVRHPPAHIRLHTQVSLATSLKLLRKVNCILMLPTPQQQEQQQREQQQQQHQQLNQLQQQQQPQQICNTSCAHTMKQYSIIYCNNGLRLRVPDIPARATSCSLPHFLSLSPSQPQLLPAVMSDEIQSILLYTSITPFGLQLKPNRTV